MLITSLMRAALGCGLLFLIFALPLRTQADEKTVWQLRREVEDRKVELIRAQRQLALSAANLALAEGKRDLAITELSNALGFCQSENQWIRDHANQFCDPRELMTENMWETSKVALRLAELKGDAATQAAEWKKIVGFHEEKLKRVERLALMLAIKPEEKLPAEEALANARKQLAAAEKAAAAQGKKITPPK